MEAPEGNLNPGIFCYNYYHGVLNNISFNGPPPEHYRVPVAGKKNPDLIT